MKLKFLFLTLFVAGALNADAAYKNIAAIASPEDKQFPLIELNGSVADGQARAPFSGDLIAVDPEVSSLFGGACLAMSLTNEYDLSGKIYQAAYTVLLYGFTPTDSSLRALKQGDVLGRLTLERLRAVIISSTVDQYLVMMSTQKPVQMLGRYWFNASFLFSNGSTAYLNFRYKETLTDALISVAEEASEGGPGFVFYPTYKVRFKTSLDSYPEELSADDVENLVSYEQQFYGRPGVLKRGTPIKAGDYDYVLCWQTGFDKYLASEYTLQSEIWLYGGIVTYDVWKKVGYIFIRDFSLVPVEEMLNNRLKALQG